MSKILNELMDLAATELGEGRIVKTFVLRKQKMHMLRKELSSEIVIADFQLDGVLRVNMSCGPVEIVPGNNFKTIYDITTSWYDGKERE